MEVVAILIFAGVFIAFFTYQQLRLINNRYIRSYKAEIDDYLKDKGLKFLDSSIPTIKDWSKSPFSKPSNFEVKFILLKLNGTFITWTKKNYLLIKAKKNETVNEFWLEIVTTYFKNSKMTFKAANKSLNKKPKKTEKVEFVNVGENCPACNFKISIKDAQCPDCGLNFA